MVEIFVFGGEGFMGGDFYKGGYMCAQLRSLVM